MYGNDDMRGGRGRGASGMRGRGLDVQKRLGLPVGSSTGALHASTSTSASASDMGDMSGDNRPSSAYGGRYRRGGGGRYRNERGPGRIPSIHARGASTMAGQRTPSGLDDGDGDFVMDAGAGGRPYARNKPYARGPAPGRTLRSSVVIEGFDPTMSTGSVISFVVGKCGDAGVRMVRARRDTERRVVMTMETPAMATAIKNVNGTQFGDGVLSIRYWNDRDGSGDGAAASTQLDGSAAPGKQSFVDLLRTLIVSRYNIETKRLDLDRIHDDPIVKQHQLRVFDYSDPASKLGSVLCKVIQESCVGLETMSVAGNRLKTLMCFSTLSERVPGLVNLSVADNLIMGYRDLEPMNGKEFKALKELVLIGNPVRENGVNKGDGGITYTSNVKKLFPTIQMLDMVPVMEEIQFVGGSEAGRLPMKVKSGFVDCEETMMSMQKFLGLYYNVFDGDRRNAASFYSDSSVFSVTVNSVRVSRSRGAFGGGHSGTDRSFSEWWPYNRNLVRVKQPDKRVELTCVGAKRIGEVLMRMPGTLHPVNDSPDKKKFVVDAFMHGAAPNVSMYVIVHGEFRDVGAGVMRSFDRTFVVVPSGGGPVPFVIANDVWVVRYYSGNQAWFNAVAGAGSTQASPSVANPPPVVQPVQQSALPTWPNPQLPSDPAVLEQYRLQNGVTPDQHAIVLSFSQATGLNYMFSLQCLRETGWSRDAAGEAFMRAKNNIPPEAFRL